MPNVAAAEAAGETSVLPRMIEMIVGVVGAAVMADPFAIGMDVRSVGMAGLVVEVRRCRDRMSNRRRTGPVLRDVPGTAADVMTLREG
jgi:hypothetical protein